MVLLRALTRILTLTLAMIVAVTSVVTGEERISYSRDILPILSDRCFVCHGPDGEHREADLRLDLEDEAKVSAVVAGMAQKSELFLRITSDDPDEKMPPPGNNLSLSAEEIDLIRRWIDQGAPWQEHWAFVPPVKSEPPMIQNDAWPTNEIDNFILSQLEQLKQAPAAEASRLRWIRRVTFALTGLPPTLEEIDNFLADDSPQAYETVVDRLLASERYGERIASDWLDAARYSDTYGYQVDRDRHVWPWRQWVIKALNDNMPYDRFITEQLAGDLLPNATDDQILATTFNRLHPQKVEGGSTPEEFRIEYVADRTQTAATALMGLTMECCRCHDHKYDPLSQKEYYELSAFFDNIDEAGLYSYFTNSVPTPTMVIADETTKQKIADADAQVAAEVAKLAEIKKTSRAAFEQWLETTPAAAVPDKLKHLDFESHRGGANKSVAGKVGKGIQLSGDDAVGVRVGNFRRYDPFSVVLWINTPDVKDRAVIYHRSRAWTDAGSRGYQLLIEEGHLSATLANFWPGNAISVRTKEPIPIEQWLHVSVTYDGSSQASGLQIFINGKLANNEIVYDNLYKNINGGGGDTIAIGERFRDRGFTNGLVDEFQVFGRQLTPLEVAHLHDGEQLAAALKVPQSVAVKNDALFQYYLAAIDPAYTEQLKKVRGVRAARNGIVDKLGEIMVMRERASPRPTYLLKRGAYDARGEQVHPSTPAVLPSFPAEAPRNRLGLAHWLTQSGHPLTARIAVNRHWQMMFGMGLVRTPEDFGRQGEPPTHPELLDWLALDFVEHGWDVKRLLKQMVLSSTYRQSSEAAASLLTIDPENRLWGRMATYRLPAEMIRDNALAVSGLMVHGANGAPAKPYEVSYSFKPSKRDSGAGLYRRSLYTYWKRTAPAPEMMTLDAAKRDVCRVERERTSTPLQSLVMLNGPQFVEAARALATRLTLQHGDDLKATFTDMFRLLTSRPPTEKELQILTELYEQQLAYFNEDPERAAKYLTTGDHRADKKLDPARLAALSSVANALFSFHETVMHQ